jgi:uncharacterized protein (DUF1778 family)
VRRSSTGKTKRERGLRDAEIVKLTDADRKAMLDALSSPPKPVENLRSAFDRYMVRFGTRAPSESER